MSSKRKRKSPCPFASAKKPSKRKKGSNSFDKDRADVLAASDRGSYFEQEKLIAQDVENRREDEMVSASRAKIEGKDESAEPDSQESWQKLAGRTIVAGDRLQDNLFKSVSCRFCHADVTLLENASSKSGLGSCWIVSCQNEDCPSRSTNAAFNTTPRGKGFEINRASVLGFRAIGRGHAGASKTLSFLGLKPIDKHYWSENAKKIEAEAKNLLENELNRAAFEVKESKFALDLLDCTREQLGEVVVDCGVTIDASWCSRGWSATDAVIAAISVDTGKVVDVVHMSSSCTECKKMDKRKMEGEVSRLEYLSWFTKHEPSCYLNHEGSSAAMEAEGAKILYKRSVRCRGLRYIPFIGDGDSKAYSAVCKDQPYGPAEFIPKEECVSHVTKRMGTGLRSSLRDYKGSVAACIKI